MTSILASQPPTWLPASGDSFGVVLKPADCRVLCFGYSISDTHIRSRTGAAPRRRRTGGSSVVFSGKLEDSVEGDDDSGREDTPESGIDPRSFPLTEEEYILRLDDVANNLKCWGAVSHVRNSLEKSKERPRIGKAVSIFIDMDESGGRANEWIYK